jgi:2-polyprenyl-3-methyl-5-hydroxy-6-metoxy-1,4-benzoquinol methylase
MKFHLLHEFFEANEKHLDVGCGSGTFIGSLPRHIDSIGIDVSQPQIEYARRSYGAPSKVFLTVADGWSVIEPESFDIVTLIELVEHLEQKEVHDLLVRTYTALKPGGRIIVSTPDYDGLWPALEFVVNRFGQVPYEGQHINHFNKRRLASALEDAGFQIERLQRYMFLAPFLAAVSDGLAIWWNRIEPQFLTERFGFLLLTLGRKR